MPNGSWPSSATQPGKDIALFGGGELFRSLLAAGLVDEVRLQRSSPCCSAAAFRCCPRPPIARRLKLKKQRVYEKTGTVGLEYGIVRRSSRAR